MAELIELKFTRDEWRAIAVLARQYNNKSGIEALNEKKQKLKNLLDSYEHGLKLLEREELISKTYQSILDKIDSIM